MKLAKTLGLAVLAAMVATAFVGASSAMAVPEHPEIVLCQSPELICELESWWGEALPETGTHDVEIHFEALAPIKLLTSLGRVDCEKSLAIVTLLNQLAALVEGHLLALILEDCKRLKLFGGSEPCTITVTEVGGLSLTTGETKLTAKAKFIPSILEIEEEKIEMTTKMTVECKEEEKEVINCLYEANEATELTAHSDEEGHLLLLAEQAPLKSVGGKEKSICPETTTWDATYHAVNLDPGLTVQSGYWIEL